MKEEIYTYLYENMSNNIPKSLPGCHFAQNQKAT